MPVVTLWVSSKRCGITGRAGGCPTVPVVAAHGAPAEDSLPPNGKGSTAWGTDCRTVPVEDPCKVLKGMALPQNARHFQLRG